MPTERPVRLGRPYAFRNPRIIRGVTRSPEGPDRRGLIGVPVALEYLRDEPTTVVEMPAARAAEYAAAILTAVAEAGRTLAEQAQEVVRTWEQPEDHENPGDYVGDEIVVLDEISGRYLGGRRDG